MCNGISGAPGYLYPTKPVLLTYTMKKLSLLCVFALLQTAVFSQFRTIAESPAFEEPEDGYGRILQMKNGKTMFLVFSEKRGIELKLYDEKHKLKVTKHLNPKYGRLKMPSIEAIFETGGDAVLLIGEIDDKQPVLYRLLIDGTKGTIKKEETIGELPRLRMKQGYAMVYGGVPMPGYYVHKDPLSDYYAVAAFNSFESDRNKRIEVTLYNGAHEAVSKAFYTSPEDKYKYIKYIDMAITGETVHIVGYAYNTRTSGGNENVLVLGTLAKGADAVDVKELDFAHDLEIDKGVLKYNPVLKKMIFLAYVKESKKKYVTRLTYIDATTRKVESVKDIFPDEADAKSKELFGRKADFEGRPVNFFVNPDGSFSVVYEDLIVNTSTSTTNNFGANGRMSTSTRTRINTELNDLAVSLFDATGKQTKSYYIPKSQFLLKLQPRSFYHSNREGTAAVLEAGDQFKSFAYVNGKNKIHVLFNDVEENEERVQKGKITTIRGVSDCDAFYYTLGEPVLPQRTFLYGKPERKKDHNLVLFAVSDYDREKNMYVTLRLNVEGRNKGVQVVWMEP